MVCYTATQSTLSVLWCKGASDCTLLFCLWEVVMNGFSTILPEIGGRVVEGE